MAAVLLKRAAAARRRVSCVATSTTLADGVVATSVPGALGRRATEVFVLPTHDRSRRYTAVPSTLKQTPSTALVQRDTLLLFVVTAVFVVCWLPFFLDNYGLPVHDDLRRMYTINDVVNPLIYSFVSPMFRSDVRRCYNDCCTWPAAGDVDSALHCPPAADDKEVHSQQT